MDTVAFLLHSKIAYRDIFATLLVSYGPTHPV